MPNIGIYFEPYDGIDNDTGTGYARVSAGTERASNPQRDSTKYLYMCSYGIGGNSTSLNIYEQQVFEGGASIPGGAQYIHSRHEPANASSNAGHQMFGMLVFSVDATPDDIELRHRLNSGTGTVTCNKGWQTLIDLTDFVEDQDYVYAENATDVDAIGSPWEDLVTFDLPADADKSEWLVIAFHHWEVDNSADEMAGRILQGGSTAHAGYKLQGGDTVEEHCSGVITVISYPAQNETILSQVETTGGSGADDIEYNSMFAIRLDLFEDYAWTRDTTPTQLTPVDTDTVTGTLTHTTKHREGMTFPWLFLGSALTTNTNTNSPRTRQTLTQAGTDFMPASYKTRTIVVNDITDTGSNIVAGIVDMADATDVDIDMVMQSDANANTDADDTLIVGFTLELRKRDDMVFRCTDWLATFDMDTPIDLAGELDGSPTYAPTTGLDTITVTMGEGGSRLFVLVFAGAESAGIVDVTVMSIGGQNPTGSYKQTDSMTGGTGHTYFYWWDEAAIRAMTDFDISWTDDRTWDTNDFTYDYATFNNVNQLDPVPVTQTVNGAGVTELTLTSMTSVKKKDMVLILGCGDNSTNNFRSFDGAVKLYQHDVAAPSITAFAEGNNCNSSILCKGDSGVSNDLLFSGIVIQSAGSQRTEPRPNTLLRM